jgi:hypothetical protein
MAKIIEFYRPSPKAVLTLASNAANKAEWDAQVEEDAPATPAKDILTGLLEHADTIDQVLVLTMDKQGVLGFLGNCEGLAETLLFMELVKAQALFSRVEGPNGNGGIA